MGVHSCIASLGTGTGLTDVRTVDQVRGGIHRQSEEDEEARRDQEEGVADQADRRVGSEAGMMWLAGDLDMVCTACL